MMSWSRLLVLGIVLGTLTGCLRDDDEPIRPTRPISRLYISTSNFQTNPDLPRFDNVYLVDPADGTTFDVVTSSFRTNALGGSAIVYSPEAQLLFQSSQNNPRDDFAVQIFRVDTLRGSLARQGEPNSELLTAIRGMAYHPNRDVLFMPNAAPAASTIPPSVAGSVLANAGATQSDLYVYGRVRAKDNASLPTFRMPFPDKTIRSVFVYDINLSPENLQNMTYISTMGGANTEILGYENLPDQLVNSPDSLRTNINPKFTLTLPGVTNLLSMTYSPRLDLMIATQFVEGGGSRILFFEKFSTHTTNTSITPSRTISGSATQLVNPVSVAVDNREGARYFYVADSQAAPTGGTTLGAVFRFLITDSGDVQPNQVLRIPNRTPVGVSLDARGTIPADSTANGNGASARIRR